mmetsp:Transcript_45355/g.89338  ORF Transcript_45355/g.89338 Transcript_45355/m.89338 type:complete len:228 (+) Transcript_45355:647-1330(+)
MPSRDAGFGIRVPVSEEGSRRREDACASLCFSLSLRASRRDFRGPSRDSRGEVKSATTSSVFARRGRLFAPFPLRSVEGDADPFPAASASVPSLPLFRDNGVPVVLPLSSTTLPSDGSRGREAEIRPVGDRDPRDTLGDVLPSRSASPSPTPSNPAFHSPNSSISCRISPTSIRQFETNVAFSLSTANTKIRFMITSITASSAQVATPSKRAWKTSAERSVKNPRTV